MTLINLKCTIRTLVRAAVFFALFTSFMASAQAQGPLESLLEVFLVEQVATSDGIEETRVPVDEAEPDAILEYVLTYTNTSDQGLKGFVIKNPIPANTSYLADSASSPEGSDFKVSIDHGATFESEPVVRIVVDENGDDKEILIPADQYNALKWVVQSSLDAGTQMSMKYRVTID